MKKSSPKPKKKILKSREVDEFKIGAFCLIEIDHPETEKVEEKEKKEEKPKPPEKPPEPRKEPLVEVKVSEEEIRKKFEEAYKKGFTEGRKEGFEEGKKNGFDKGYSEGYEKGLAEGREAGYREGYKEGLEKGKTEGFLEGKKEGRELILKRYNEFLEGFQRVLGELEEAKNRWEKELYKLKDKLVDVVFVSLKKLVFAVPERQRIERMITECLEKIADEKNVVLRLNPKDWEAVADKIELPSFVRVEPDGSLKRGDCVVEMETGSVETKTEDRVRELLSILTEEGR